MYTRITHHITEEHFHNPHHASLAEVPSPQHGVGKKSIKKGKLSDSLVDIALLMRCENAWKDFLWCMHYYINGVVDGSPNQSDQANQLVNDINCISKIIGDYWGAATGQAFGTALTNLAQAQIQVVKDLTAKTNTTASEAALATAVQSFATVVDSVNPTSWPKNTVASILTSATTAWTDEARNRVNKLWSNELSAARWVHDIFIGGTADGTPGFAEIFADGISAAYPNGPTA
jgi:hypothetical protein